MKEKTFQYRDFEGQLDLADYLVCERWESAFAGFGEDCKKADASSTGSGKVKGVIEACASVFERVFPEQNAAERILCGTTSLDEAADALGALIEFVTGQAESNNRWKDLVSKYTPNRRQKRSVK